ncbi:MAG TPA: methyl-accepting chemotaxis protein [Nitrospiraceae bacterium]|nr:MAG: hypothetical protein A2Z82_08375 [Nitrospirae bacterium GWA2_46_11]OGW23342.1 MAG: hypothetical protein A2X55_10815 [Nitrospirae bacterium GWB2_47_37]HAK87800.1 methyl-accepting chemotaxis protein [Nitrospiraceae bacterium]HCZ11827.1 methyl-accepting chemotaxis protein [Nitrospiraceae bacterium]
MFKNMTVKGRMTLFVGSTGLFAVVIVLIGFLTAVSLSSMLGEMNEGSVLATKYLANTQDAMWKLRFGISQYVAVTDPASRKKIIDESSKWFGIMDENLKLYAAVNLTGEMKQALKELSEIYAAYKEARPKWFELMEAGKIDEAAAFRSKTILISGAGSVKALDNLIELQAKQSAEIDRTAASTAKRTKIMIIAGGVILISISILMAGWIALTLRRQLGGEPMYAADVARKVSQGDLALDIAAVNSKDGKGGDSVLYAMKIMVKNLKDIIINVKSTADNVASASQQLSSTSAQMSKGAGEEAGKASQIATSSEEMSQTVVDIAKNASNIELSATKTTKIAQEGEQIVDRSVAEVKAIADTVRESAQLMGSLGERSKQIGEIVSVINDIADQTNLLALNAAIEAARAGEQGRGFAVVADEVRKLAERTAKATSEIGEMIKAIQDEVSRAVHSMEEGTKRVEVGVEFSVKAGDALRNIVNSVNELHSMVQQIASATEEMSTVSEQISGDIETIASVSKETSSGAEQIAGASSDLARLASNLQNIVGQFKV